jgi:hypothetical protein
MLTTGRAGFVRCLNTNALPTAGVGMGVGTVLPALVEVGLTAATALAVGRGMGAAVESRVGVAVPVAWSVGVAAGSCFDAGTDTCTVQAYDLGESPAGLRAEACQ